MNGYPYNNTYSQQHENFFYKNRKHIIIVVSITLCCLFISIIFSSISKYKLNKTNFSLSIDFTKHSSGSQYSEADINSDFKNINSIKGIKNLCFSNNGLDFLLPAGKSCLEDSGSQINVSIPENDEYTLEYNIFFEDDFNWACGGILCGLSGGTYYDGDSPTSTGDGFNIILSWDSYGSIIPRIFHENQINPHGDIYDIVGTFETGKWYNIKMYVKTNSLYESNGIVKICINGTECLSKENLCFSSRNLKLDSAIIQASHYLFISEASTTDQTITFSSITLNSSNTLSDTKPTTNTNNNYSSNEYAFNLPGNTNGSTNLVPTSTLQPNLSLSDSAKPIVSTKPLKTIFPTNPPSSSASVPTTQLTISPDKPEDTPKPIVVSATPTEVPEPKETPKPININASISFDIIDSWNTGYSANFVITNNTDKKITNWTITLNSSDFKFTSLWNGKYEEKDGKYYITPADYNYTIEKGQSICIGFCSDGVYNDNSYYSLSVEN